LARQPHASPRTCGCGILKIPWPEIIAFRNILVHAYFGIDWGVVWLAAVKQVPVLRCQVAAVLDAEFDSPPG
jgi:uncharacterized protein with HEPN domain